MKEEKKFCQDCGGRINEKAVVCPHCGVKIKSLSERSPVLAAFLSFFIFGLGQIYTGQIGKTVGMWVLVIILLAITGATKGGAAPITLLLLVILYIYGICDAYRKAKE